MSIIAKKILGEDGDEDLRRLAHSAGHLPPYYDLEMIWHHANTMPEYFNADSYTAYDGEEKLDALQFRGLNWITYPNNRSNFVPTTWSADLRHDPVNHDLILDLHICPFERRGQVRPSLPMTGGDTTVGKLRADAHDFVERLRKFAKIDRVDWSDELLRMLWMARQ